MSPPSTSQHREPPPTAAPALAFTAGSKRFEGATVAPAGIGQCVASGGCGQRFDDAMVGTSSSSPVPRISRPAGCRKPQPSPPATRPPRGRAHEARDHLRPLTPPIEGAP
jgi:hypothetical protein